MATDGAQPAPGERAERDFGRRGERLVNWRLIAMQAAEREFAGILAAELALQIKALGEEETADVVDA